MFEQKITGIVLKKQPVGETDELVTVFSREMGKVRLRAAGTKKPASKLNFAIQNGSISKFRLVGKSPFYRLAGAETVFSIKNIYSNLDKSQAFFIFSEIISISTPDEHPDQRAYNFVERALKALSEYSDDRVDVWLCKFGWGWSSLIGFDLSQDSPRNYEVLKLIDQYPENSKDLRIYIIQQMSLNLERKINSASVL